MIDVRTLKRVENQLRLEKRLRPDLTGALATGEFYQGDIEELLAAVRDWLAAMPLIAELSALSGSADFKKVQRRLEIVRELYDLLPQQREAAK